MNDSFIKRGVRLLVPDELFFRVLDYHFAFGIWGWGFWILGLVQVLGIRPYSHGFDKEISSGI